MPYKPNNSFSIPFLSQALPVFLLIFLFACKSKVDLPHFDLLKSDSTTLYSSGAIEKNKPLLLILFSPDCEHCQKFTKSLLDSINYLRDFSIVFATNDPIERLKAFESHFGTKSYPNIVLGRDVNYFFPRLFKNQPPPIIAVYNKEKALKNIFYGAPTIKQILYLSGK